MSLDVSTMMPSQARKALTQLFFDKMLSGGLYENAKPKFDYVDALGVVDNMDEYAKVIMPECFRQAVAAFDSVYPLCWSNEHQRAYRKGLNEPR